MDKPEPTKKIGRQLHLSLIKALQKTLPHVCKAPKIKFLQKLFSQEKLEDHPDSIGFVEFLLQHPLAAEKLQQKYHFRWVVIKQWTRRTKKEVKIIYDATHAVIKNESSPIHYFVLNKREALTQHIINDSLQLPKLTFSSKNKMLFRHQQPLWQILEHEKNPSDPKNDPQSTLELEAYLKDYTRPNTFVKVFFICLPEKNKPKLWIESKLDLSKPLLKVINVYAWTSNDYEIVYSKDPDQSLIRAKRNGKKLEEKFAQYQERIKQLEERTEENPNPFQNNNASGINLSHSGLNLAYNLRLISSRQELAQFSNKLSSTLASLYIFVDEKNHLRHATYYDKDKTFSVEVTCYEDQQTLLDHQRCEKAASSMLNFWQRVWQRRQHWIKERQLILKPLINYLDSILPPKEKTITNPLTRCRTELQKIIHLQRVLMFTSQESHLHAIKFYLADFGYHSLTKFKGVTIKAQSDGTLTMLNIPGLSIVNLHNYFATKNDADFFLPIFCPNLYNPSTTIIPHKHKHLKRLPYTKEEVGTTLWMHCKQTGKKCSQHILEYWKKFCQNLLAIFYLEVHGQTNIPSASFLSFQCVWTAYAQKAGPMAQSLEKCKPYYEDLLRQNSKGGFMFSIEDALDQGDPLWPTLNNTVLAQAVAEMDLVSAYGYAASRSYIPSGFCTGFGNATGNSLEKLDKKSRHKTFEFRAIYRILDQLIHKEKIAIRSVYSNFSPLGLFCLGSYPIDLVVVTEEGQFLLYQMDGQWTHGCPAHCEELELYANDQTYEQVRKKTNQRDKDTMAWINTLNKSVENQWISESNKKLTTSSKPPRVQYKIIYDCHSEGFSSGSLDYHFNTTPKLAQMIQGYNVVNSLGNTITPKKLESLMNSTPSRDFTFIAKATIQISNHSKEPFYPYGPLVVYQPRPNKHTQHSLSYSGNIILTRDYYEWLKEAYHSVQLQQLEWVLFYKTEPLFNELYNHLIQLRSSTQDTVIAAFLKRMINLSCGFFGSRTKEHNKTTYRLVNGLPSSYHFFRHHFDMDHSADVGKASYMVLETMAWPKQSAYRKVSSSAIPIFLCIIEYGKLRLMQVLNFFQRHIHPLQFRLLYSNIDNLVFALGNANTLTEAIHSSCTDSFYAEKQQYLAEEDVKTPGKVKLEWIRNGTSGWKFISLRTQHYCLVVSESQQGNGNLHKTSGWTHLSSPEAYALAKKMLAGHQVKLIQTRRINKKCNMDTHQVEFTYGAASL